MTQTSYFQDGTTHGDATKAPYGADIFADILNTIYSSNGGYVIPGYLNSFTADGSGTGAAFIKGVLYIDSTGSLTGVINPNTSGKYRIDRVVVRVDKLAHTAIKYIKQGIASDYPTPPSLLQTDTVYEFPLAQYYIDPTSTAVSVIDERKFANTTWHSVNYTTKNLIGNGEFIGGFTHWAVAGAPTVTYITQFAALSRGYAAKVVAPTAADGIQQVVRVGKPGNTVVTFKCMVQVESGVCFVAAGTEDCLVYPSREPKEIILRGVYAVATDLSIVIRGNLATGSVFYVSGISITHGYIDCPYESENEIILFKGAQTLKLNGPAFDGAYGINLPLGTKAALVMLAAKDSNSSGANVVNAVLNSRHGTGPLLRVDIGRLPNNTYGRAYGWIHFEPNTTGSLTSGVQEVNMTFNASGTLIWELFLWGIMV